MIFAPESQAPLFLKKEAKNLPTCNTNDIVMIWDGSKADQVFIGLSGVLASTMVRINIRENSVDKRFLYYLLSSKFEILNTQTTGSTIPHVSKTLFQDLLIPLPPLNEQREISGSLQTVDRKIEAEEARKEALDTLFRSLLHYLMTAKIRLPTEFIAQFKERKP